MIYNQYQIYIYQFRSKSVKYNAFTTSKLNIRVITKANSGGQKWQRWAKIAIIILPTESVSSEGIMPWSFHLVGKKATIF